MQIDRYVAERRKQRKKRYKYFLAIAGFLVVYFVALGIFVFIVRSPAFQAEQITIQGNSAVSTAQIMQLLQASIIRKNDSPSSGNSGTKALLGFKSMLIWPDALPSSTVALIPQLAGVTIAKNYFLHTITVNIAERQPFAIWCVDPSGDCFWFDDTGTIFAHALQTQGGAISVINDTMQDKLNLNEKILPDEFLPDLLSILDVLKQSGVGVANITLPDISLQQVNVQVVKGPMLYFSLQFSSDEDLSVLQNLMTTPGFNNLQYIDFTVQNRAYYK